MRIRNRLLRIAKGVFWSLLLMAAIAAAIITMVSCDPIEDSDKTLYLNGE